MNMTHYMELLAVNQPLEFDYFYVANSVILAETLAITELYLLFTRKFTGFVHQLNRFAGNCGRPLLYWNHLLHHYQRCYSHHQS
jgi:hypothetical protein